MPFTFSHVAAVLPARGDRFRRFANFPALAIGALAPDASYVLELLGPSYEAHTPLGALTVAWPTAWVMYATYRAFAPFWIGLFPWLDDGTEARGWLPVALGTLVGVLTHVVWDAFTHQGSFFVAAFPALFLAPVALPWGRTIPVFNFLQHTSSLVGAIALLWAAHGSRRRRGLPFTTSVPLAVKMTGGFVGFWAIFLLLPFPGGHARDHFPLWLADAAFRGFAAGAFLFVAAGALGRRRLTR